ncbi:serine protease [Pseudonocardiaceae bacterium YIM PH 21723]|nr:serine protease [Pseudonocardiaceae bacterium YIM PH 21723]
MRKSLLAFAAAATLGAAAFAVSPAIVDPVAQIAAKTTLAGAVDLKTCSASIIKLTGSQPDDHALMMTNGHCVTGSNTPADEVVVNEAYGRARGNPFDANGKLLSETLFVDKILYSTMKDTDLGIYQLAKTYKQLAELNVPALLLSDQHPVAGTPIDIPTGFHKVVYSCAIDGFVPKVKEGVWTWTDSIRYTPAKPCGTQGGSSGSPIVDPATGKVVGVNNTGNANGTQCAVNSPCEVDANGKTTSVKSGEYGQQTFQIYGCLGAGSTIDLSKPGCALPKPKK